MQIPDWLMPSMYLSSDKESAQLSINYLLRAQVVPVDDIDWMDSKCTISTFNGSRMIFVTKPQHQAVDPDQKKKTLKADVGGCCGCFTTHSESKITFDKK